MIARTTFRLASSLLLGGLLLAVSSCDINDNAASTAGGTRTGSYAPRLVMADGDPILPVGRIVAAVVGSEPRIQSIALWNAGSITLNGLPFDQDLFIRIEGWTADTLVWSGLRQVRLGAGNPATDASIDAFPVTYAFPVDTPTLAAGVSRIFAESVDVRFTTRLGVVIRYETGSQVPVTRLSTEYDPTDPPVLQATDTIRARAYRLGVPSSVATFVFVQDDAAGPSRPQLDPSVNSAFITSLALKFQVPAGIQVFYTTDGSDPRSSIRTTRRLYDPSQPEILSTTTTIVATAFRTSDQKYSGVNEWVLEKVDAVPVGKPIFAPTGGTVYLGDSIHIRLPSLGECSEIRYLADGRSPVGPSAYSLTYQNPIVIPPEWKDSTKTIIAACYSGDVPGDTAMATYQIRERTAPTEPLATKLGTNWPVSGSGRQFLQVGGRMLAATDIGLYEYTAPQGWKPSAAWPAGVRNVIDLAATGTEVYALTADGICMQDVAGVGAWDCANPSFVELAASGPNRILATGTGLLVSTDSAGVASFDHSLKSSQLVGIFSSAAQAFVPVSSMVPLGSGDTAFVGLEGSAGKLYIGNATTLAFNDQFMLYYHEVFPVVGLTDAVSVNASAAGSAYAAYLGTRSAVYGFGRNPEVGGWNLVQLGAGIPADSYVHEVIEVRGRAYAATWNGAYWLDLSTPQGTWKRIAGSPEYVNRLTVSGSTLYLASRDGVWSVPLP